MKSLIIGIDVSKESLDICIYGGKNHKDKKIEYTTSSILKFFRKYEKKKELYSVVMEATGVYHLSVANLLKEKGFKVYVVNPLKIKKFADMKMIRAKTDSLDSKIIAMFGDEQPKELTEFNPADTKRQRLIKLLKCFEDLDQSCRAWKNRKEAIDHEFIDHPETMDVIRKMIKTIEVEKKKVEKQLEILAKEYDLPLYKKLRGIKSIGLKSACVIIGFFGCFENFENSKQVISFVGSNPSPKQSGKSVNGRSSISKKGHKQIRNLLYMCTLTAAQYNKSCRETYQRLKDVGKKDKQARIAVVNKLLKQAFAIVKYNREYDENYHEKLRMRFAKN